MWKDAWAISQCRPAEPHSHQYRRKLKGNSRRPSKTTTHPLIAPNPFTNEMTRISCGRLSATWIDDSAKGFSISAQTIAWKCARTYQDSVHCKATNEWAIKIRSGLNGNVVRSMRTHSHCKVTFDIRERQLNPPKDVIRPLDLHATVVWYQWRLCVCLRCVNKRKLMESIGLQTVASSIIITCDTHTHR